jgi:sporulation protein YlmC with PRC-barrel domain
MTLMRFMTMTAIAAALAMPVSAGFAQPATAPNPSNPATTPAPHAASPTAGTPAPHAAAPAATTHASRHMASTEMRASKLIGSAVYDAGDQKIGSIADLIVDRDGKVGDVIVGVGSFLGGGDKNVAVKMADLKRGKDDHLVFNTTKDALKQMALYDLNHPSAERSGSTIQK